MKSRQSFGFGEERHIQYDSLRVSEDEKATSFRGKIEIQME